MWGASGETTVFATWVSQASDGDAVNADPVFVSAGTDFHITSASSAKDVGDATLGLTSDYDGINVPQGAGVDIGAYEYIGDIHGIVYDWLGNNIVGIAVNVYVYELTGTGIYTRPALAAYIASGQTSTVNGSWVIDDADIDPATEYFVLYFYGGSYLASDGNTFSNLVGTKFITSE